MQVPEQLRYSEEHEWVLVADGVATIGITDHAQEQLGDIVFVELPAARHGAREGGTLGVVESVKAVSDVYAPVGGTVVTVNDRLTSNPRSSTRTPTATAGW